MNEKIDFRIAASQTLCRDLDSLEQTVQVFSNILELDVVAQAKHMERQLEQATKVYYEETWDASESLTTSLDSTFSELDYEMTKLAAAVGQLDQSMSELKAIYEDSVLPQLIVMLVGSLEVYLTNVFRACLAARLNLNERAVSEIAGRYNFQNWKSSVDAFQTFLEVKPRLLQ